MPLFSGIPYVSRDTGKTSERTSTEFLVFRVCWGGTVQYSLPLHAQQLGLTSAQNAVATLMQGTSAPLSGGVLFSVHEWKKVESEWLRTGKTKKTQNPPRRARCKSSVQAQQQVAAKVALVVSTEAMLVVNIGATRERRREGDLPGATHSSGPDLPRTADMFEVQI